MSSIINFAQKQQINRGAPAKTLRSRCVDLARHVASINRISLRKKMNHKQIYNKHDANEELIHDKLQHSIASLLIDRTTEFSLRTPYNRVAISASGVASFRD